MSHQLVVAQSIQSLLGAEGLHPMPISVAPHISLAGVDQGYDIKVPKAEVSSATELLTQGGYERLLVA